MENSTLIFDLDETLCTKKQPNETYLDVKPIQNMIDLVNELHDKGHTIVIETARNMVTQNNFEAKVIKNVGHDTLTWLQNNNVKYDGIKFAKTYGEAYCDDKAIRPNELLYLKETNQLDDITAYLKNEVNMCNVNNTINLLKNKYLVCKWFYIEEDSTEKVVSFSIAKGFNSFSDLNTKLLESIRINCDFEIMQIFDNEDEAIKFKNNLMNEFKSEYFLD